MKCFVEWDGSVEGVNMDGAVGGEAVRLGGVGIGLCCSGYKGVVGFFDDDKEAE